MHHSTPADLLEQLNWRYATKKFDPAKTVPTETWAALEESLVLTPSSYGLQPWKFIIVTDQQIRGQLQSHSWNQTQVTECSHYVVFAIKKNLTTEHIDHFIARTAEVRSMPVEALAGYRKAIVGDVVYGPRSFSVNEWASRQAYIALGNFMTCAAILGVDTCPMEGIDPSKYDGILGLSEKGYATVVACAAGYRSEDDRYASLAKVRFTRQEVLEVL